MPPFTNILPIFPQRPNVAPAPIAAFNLLLIGQGFGGAPPPSVIRRAWTAISSVVFGAVPRQPHLAVYSPFGAQPDLGVELGLDGRLVIPAAKANALADYLAIATFHDSKNELWNALQVWPRFGRAGAGMGNLVALLVKGSPGTPGELYETETSDRYPIPVVGAIVDGSPNWMNVIARGFAQKFASLFDEFDLDGPDFSVPPDDYLPRARNLFFTTPTTRAAIAAIKAGTSQAKLADVAAEAAELWRVALPPSTPIDVRTDDTANPPITPDQQADTTVGMFEGGGLYRHNVFRANRDCLMRRIPLTTATPTRPPELAVQSNAQFCEICASILSGQIGEKSEILSRPPLTLANQRLEFDRVLWRTREKRPGKSETLVKTAIGHRAPFWSFSLVVGGAASALQVSDVKHTGRTDVLAGVMPDVIQSVQYKVVSVTLSEGTAVSLPIAEALANSKQPAVFEVASDGGPAHEYDFGCKLTLSWPRAGWIFEVSQSLVLKAANNDIDPGHAVTACKVYPQIAFRYFPDPRATATGNRPTVKKFEGVVICDIANAIPASAATQLAPFKLDDLASGHLATAMFVDSNTTGDTTDNDGKYLFNKAQFASPAATAVGFFLAESPAFALRDAFWQTGRKLARVVETQPTNPKTWAGGVARYEYLTRHSVPPLPLWSWVFDYVRGDLSQGFSFAGIYCATDPADGDRGRLVRKAEYKWPPTGTFNGVNNYRMKIRKFARQGFYDNLHVHPSPLAPHFTEAPFCADICMHFHWRWGVLAGDGPDPYTFLGWGDGRRGRGGHTTLGGPLIPPNQHLDIDITRNGSGAVGVGYRVRVLDPSPDQIQVLFEQGASFAFSYAGSLRPVDLARLSVAINAINGIDITGDQDFKGTRNRLETEQANPNLQDVFDGDVRSLFHKIYEKLQFYEKDVDDMTADGVQQIPDGNVPDPTQPPGTLPLESV